MYTLEEVFKLSGLPTVTFVEPDRYNEILIALRTPGRGVIIEGPSGIGKTMCVKHIMKEIGLENKYLYLTPRKPDELRLIESLSDMIDQGLGTVIVDDFHLLEENQKQIIGDLIKLFADEESKSNKIIVIGINSVGQALVNNIADLASRISTFPLESNPDYKIRELIEKGERALNISIQCKENIISEACGSFYITQLVCQHICMMYGVLNTQARITNIDINYKSVADKVVRELDPTFRDKVIYFAQGNRNRGGHRPYYNMLRWLSEEKHMTLNLIRATNRRPKYRAGIGQILDRGHIDRLFSKHTSLRNLFYFNNDSKELCIEDPRLLFYLRNIDWKRFESDCGFTDIEDKHAFEIAISFAGEQRHIAELIRDYLVFKGITLFYDYDYKHLAFGNDLEKFLLPIYESDSKYIVVLFSQQYPYKFWTQKEYKSFCDRFQKRGVLPIYVGKPPSNPEDILFGFEVIPEDCLLDDAKLNQRVYDICDVILQKFN